MSISTAGVCENDGKYLIALRKPGTSIGERWEFPGGKVKKGESPQEALKREFFEELRVTIEVGELFCSGYFTNHGQRYRLKAFRATILDPGNLSAQEHQQLLWADINTIQTLNFPESDSIIVDTLLTLHNGS